MSRFIRVLNSNWKSKDEICTDCLMVSIHIYAQLSNKTNLPVVDFTVILLILNDIMISRKKYIIIKYGKGYVLYHQKV